MYAGDLPLVCLWGTLIRYRPSAGRLIVELFYGNDHITRDNGLITVAISKLARKLHVRPSRLCETLEWMQSFGIITRLTLGRKDATLCLVEPEWRKQRQATSERLTDILKR